LRRQIKRSIENAFRVSAFGLLDDRRTKKVKNYSERFATDKAKPKQ
jgi:hypothetical protein